MHENQDDQQTSTITMPAYQRMRGGFKISCFTFQNAIANSDCRNTSSDLNLILV